MTKYYLEIYVKPAQRHRAGKMLAYKNIQHKIGSSNQFLFRSMKDHKTAFAFLRSQDIDARHSNF